MEQTPIGKLLLKLSPPVMLALLIQSIYNIVDSYFVAHYSADGLTALSIIYPIQLLMVALATGAGAGINILVSRMDGMGECARQKDVVKTGLWLGLVQFVAFAAVGLLLVQPYFALSSDQLDVQTQGVQYARVIFAGSFGMFLEAHCTKLLQAKGNMMLPMAAQVTGAILNVVLDPLLIFGYGPFPELGVTGAAIATVVGQWVAMGMTVVGVLRRYELTGRFRAAACRDIYQAGIPSIVMQSLYTLYMVGLNLVLKGFTEDAVTVLGIYYKLQTFFFIPLLGLEQVILPIISFNYGAKNTARVRETVKDSLLISTVVMTLATVVFLVAPDPLLSIFSAKPAIHTIGRYALRVIATGFIPAGFGVIFITYFQGTDRGRASLCITIVRQVILLVPLAWVFHFIGLKAVWYTFPVTEVLILVVSLALLRRPVKQEALKTTPAVKQL